MGKTLNLYDRFPIKVSIKEGNRDMVISDSGVKAGIDLICNVTATHSGTLINNRIYPPKSMKKGLKSWTSPYKKPVLVNHNEDTDPIGRVIKAKYLKTPKGMSDESYTPILKASDGYGYTDLTVKITDKAAIEKILDGRYETVSVRMSTDHAFCSVCGADWADDDGPCEHEPGKKYDNKLAYMTTGDLTYREVSFVNIPADEYAKVDGTIFTEKDSLNDTPVNVKMYASNAEEKVLCDMNDDNRYNLYDQLKGEYDEEDDIIFHLIDKSIGKNDRKEDQMSQVKELTKDQLKEMDAVSELIQEAVDGANTECEEKLNKLKEDFEKTASDSSDEGLTKQIQDEKEKNDALQESQVALTKEKDALEQETNQLKDSLDKREEERKTLLDENVTLNSELHKLNAERMYDLKTTLGKPDVADIKTIEDREKKVEEFAQRSIDSLKDQINDLLIEKAADPDTPKLITEVENPGIENEDTGARKVVKSNNRETKGETLNRLFKPSDKQ